MSVTVKDVAGTNVVANTGRHYLYAKFPVTQGPRSRFAAGSVRFVLPPRDTGVASSPSTFTIPVSLILAVHYPWSGPYVNVRRNLVGDAEATITLRSDAILVSVIIPSKMNEDVTPTLDTADKTDLGLYVYFPLLAELTVGTSATAHMGYAVADSSAGDRVTYEH